MFRSTKKALKSRLVTRSTLGDQMEFSRKGDKTVLRLIRPPLTIDLSDYGIFPEFS